MGALRQRLSWTDDGALHDGPRRYLMMRTDVLMGTLVRLPAAVQGEWLRAWAASTCEHGAASLEAYAQMVNGDSAALIDATVRAAADLGWGRWTISAADDHVLLQVHGSPFVHGWQAAASPQAQAAAALCAPIAGMFSALAGLLLQGPVTVTESCAGTHRANTPTACSFVARLALPASTTAGAP